MTNKQIVLEPFAPWSSPHAAGVTVLPVATDPRVGLSDQALVLATQNAYPIVAAQKGRRDNLGLAAGAAIAVVLGVSTFASMSGHRSDKLVAATGSKVIQPASLARAMPAFLPPSPAYPTAQTATHPPMKRLHLPGYHFSDSVLGRSWVRC